jgi:hypothetical protein
MSNATARTFDDAIVTAKCMDCELEFTGPLGVRVVETIEGPTLEIVVVASKRNEIHAIARVDVHLVPVTRAPIAPLPPTGSA